MKLNVDGNDPNIERTVVSYSGGTLTIRYGQQITDFEMTYFLPISISVVPVSGYQFSNWVYRLGSATATQVFDEAYPFEYDGTLDLYIRAVAKEEETMTTPTKWSWSFSNGEASDDETVTAKAVIDWKQNTEYFSHKVWNDMVQKVADIKTYLNLGWDTTYGTLRNTKFQTSPYELTATMFNSLRNNLELAGAKVGLKKIDNSVDEDDAAWNTVPHPAHSGKKVFGDYFLTLASYMNQCIDKL